MCEQKLVEKFRKRGNETRENKDRKQDCHPFLRWSSVRAERCIRGSFEGKSSRIIPSGVRDRLRKWHIVKSDGESSDARGSRLTDSSDVGWMVLDVIAREITRRFERALLPPPRHLPLFPPSLALPSSPSPLHTAHNLSSPEVHRYFTYHDTYFSPTFVERRAFLLPLDIQPLPLPPSPSPRRTPAESKGASSHIPFAPIFHKRY